VPQLLPAARFIKASIIPKTSWGKAVTLITQKLLFLPLLENPGELGAFALEACFLGDPLKAFAP
jgi:hypothetical protein